METLQYEIIVAKKLENALAEVDVCKFRGHCLKLTKKSLVGLATELKFVCVNCNVLQTSFNNCDHINVKTNYKPQCKAMTTLYDLNVRLVYSRCE